MGVLTNMLRQVGQQQNAPAQPALGNLLKTTPSQPAPSNALSSFAPDSLESYIANNLDYNNLRGGMWSDPNYGPRGTVADMAQYLRKSGFNSGADFQNFDPQKDPARWLGMSQVDGNNGWTRLIPNATGGRRFGNGFAGDGGTQYYVDYDPGNKKFKFSTKGIATSDKEAIMGALASVGLVVGAAGIGGALGGAGAASGTTAGGVAGGTAGGTAAGTAGLIDLGGGLAMTADGAIVGSTMAGGAGMSGAALEGFISGAGLGGSGAMGAGAAGMTDLGGGLSMGADGAITGATGLNPSTLSNAGLMESFGAGGSGVAGVGGAGGGGGSGGAGGAAPTGTPPPANPYHPASYLNTTNLSNLAKAGMSNFSWTDLIGPGLQLIGGAMNADAAKDASDAQLQAAREAAARFEPWRQAGAWGVGRAATMLGKEGPEAAKAAFAVDPGYQWRLSQGENALERAASARGLLGSGRYLKDAMRFNQGEASQEFGNAYNRLTNLAGLGQTATQSSADYLTQGANAQAAGRVGQANAWNNALGQGYGMYESNRLMRGLGY
jgi:hypothetical protein